MGWLTCVAMLGCFMAVPLKRQLINIDKLTFPTGTATAETLRSLHSTGAKAMQQAKTLVLCALVGGAVKFWQEGMRIASDLSLGPLRLGMVQGNGLPHSARNPADVPRRDRPSLAETLRPRLRALDPLHRRRRPDGHPRRYLDARRSHPVLRRPRPHDGSRSAPSILCRRRATAPSSPGPSGLPWP